MTTMTSPTAPSHVTSSPTPTSGAADVTTPRQPTSWLDRYRQAPSIYQWAIAIALGVMVWLFAEDFVWSTAARWNEENARMQTALEEGANRAELLSGVRDAIPPVGRIVVPRAEKDGTEELLRAINKVLEEQKIEKESIERQVRPGGNMAPPPELVQLVGEGTKLGKVVGEVRFSATQEKVIKVIAGLEATEMIESISRLKLSREPSSKKVGVTLTVEAWVQLDRKSRGAR